MKPEREKTKKVMDYYVDTYMDEYGDNRRETRESHQSIKFIF